MGAGASAEALGEAGEAGGDPNLAHEGYDSDLEAEALEDYIRRPDAEFGEAARDTLGGRLSSAPGEGAPVFPCHDKIKVPAGYETPEDAHELPSETLRLDCVHGYRAHDARANLYFTSQGHAVYHAAAVGVVMDVASRRQRFFQGHTDDILCLDVTSDGKTVATGQCGADPAICVWDAATCKLKCELKGVHQTAVLALAFSPDGSRLASVGKDPQHTLAFWDLATGQVLATAACGPRRVYCLEIDPLGRIVSGGDGHLKFWELSNGFLAGQPAQWTGSPGQEGFSPSTVLSLCFTPDGATFAGTKGGCIYKFEEGGARALKKWGGIHKGSINALSFTGEGILSAGRDGKVLLFDLFMRPKLEVPMVKVVETVVDEEQQPLAYPEPPSVRSACYDPASGSLLVGLKTSEVYIVKARGRDDWKAPGGARLLTCGHAAALDPVTKRMEGEVAGIACHPRKGLFVSAGDDRSVRLWSCADRQMVRARVLRDAARCASFHPRKDHLAVGCKGGSILVIDLSTGKSVSSLAAGGVGGEAAGAVTALKYSPCGRFLAAAGEGGVLRVYDAHKGQVGGYGLVAATPPAGSAVTHLDWSADSKLLHTNTAAMDIHVWTAPGCQEAAPADAAQAEWATWTCILGWPVQGIWGAGADGADVNAACRSNRGEWVEGECSLATADDFGRVRLFKYPSDVGRGKSREYLGHSSHVSSAAFTFNDKFVVTAGGGDRCVFVWRHLEELEDDNSDSDSSDDEEEEGEGGRYGGCKANRTVEMVPCGMENGRVVYEPVNATEGEPNPYKNHSLRELGARRGYKSPMVGRPCMGQMHVPTSWEAEVSGGSVRPGSYDKCGESLKLDWAYGYRGHDTRQNVLYNASGEVVYHAAALGIVLNRDTMSQRHVTDDPQSEGEAEGNTDDILCLARSPADKDLFASGEVGRQPKILVWSTRDMKSKACLQGFHTRAVVSLCFSPHGKFIASVGLDSNHSVALWGWEREELLATYKADTNKVLHVMWSPYDYTVLTTGKKHIKFALLPEDAREALQKGTRIKLKKGVLSGGDGKVQTFYATCFTAPGVALVGTRGGEIYRFEGHQLSKTKVMAHKGRVGALHAVVGEGEGAAAAAALVLSGGDDGVVRAWDPATLAPKFTVAALPGPAWAPPGKGLTGAISSVFCDAANGAILVGTKLNEVYVVPGEAAGPPATRLVEAHAEGEVWGLAVHPLESQAEVATGGDDGTVRVWDLARRALSRSRLIVPDPAPVPRSSFNSGCVRSCAYSPDGSMLAVGLFCGDVHVLNSSDLSDVRVLRDHTEWVADLKWSPDGKLLATAAHDNTCRVYCPAEGWACKATCRGHSSFLTSVNWSADGTKLVTTSGDYEILHWEVPSGGRVRSSATCRDVEWASETGVLGWPVLGVWYKGSDGTDVNAVDVRGGKCVATGDDRGIVSLLKYPALGGDAKVYGGHSSHVTCVRFGGAGGRALFSTGGLDSTLCQWKVAVDGDP